MNWQEYRMWYRREGGSWKESHLTFRGRTQEEAQRKARKFWVDAEFSSGAMICLPEGQRPDLTK